MVLDGRAAGGPRGVPGWTADGLRVEKVLRLEAATFRVGVELRVEAATETSAAVTLYWTSPVALAGTKAEEAWLTLRGDRRPPPAPGSDPGGRDRGRPDVLEAPAPALKDPKESPAGPELKNPHLVPVSVQEPGRPWVALENDYFMAALIPPADGRAVLGPRRTSPSSASSSPRRAAVRAGRGRDRPSSTWGRRNGSVSRRSAWGWSRPRRATTATSCTCRGCRWSGSASRSCG